MGTVCIAIIISVIMSFLAPFLFAGAAAVLNGIFKAFTNPFQFVVGTGETNWFTSILSADLLNVIVKIMISAGVVLSVFILATSLFKLFFSGMVRKVDSPIATCIRALIAIFLCYWMIDILYGCVFPIFQWLLDKVNDISVSGSQTVAQAVDSFFTTANANGSVVATTILDGNSTSLDIFGALANVMTFEVFGQVLSLIIFIVFLFKVMIGLFRMVSEMAERFLLINVLTVFSPLVSSTIISNSTMPIFISWVQMMIANGLVLIFNSLGMVMLKMGFINVGIACSAYGGDWMKAIIAMIVYNALIKVVQKFDVYLAQLTFKIQAVGDNQRSMTFGNLLHVASGVNRNLADVAGHGGIVNDGKLRAANLLGFFTGNRTGAAKHLSDGAMDYMAQNKARDKAFGKTLFEETKEGRESRMRSMAVKLADAQNAEMLEKTTAMETQKARNKAVMLGNTEYQAAIQETEVADMTRKTAEMQDAEYVEAATDMDAAKRSLDAQIMADADVQEAAAEQKAAELDMRTHVVEDSGVQDAQRTYDIAHMESDVKEKMSHKYVKTSKEAALADEYVRHKVGNDTAVQTLRVENEARAMDVRARAGSTDLGIEAQARTAENTERAREDKYRRKFNGHVEESEQGEEE